MITNETSSGVSLPMIFQSVKIDTKTNTHVQAISALLSQVLANNRCAVDGLFTNTIERWEPARHFTCRLDETAFLTPIGDVK